MTKRNKAILGSILRTDYSSFCRRAFETLHDDKQLSADPYIDVVCSQVEKVAHGEVRRLVINLPPRHGKTILATVCLAAWVLGNNPAERILIICYGEELAHVIARDVRQILGAAWFVETFGSIVAKSDDRAGTFRTVKGGALLATSFGGAYVGFGADLVVVDDPSKIADASSPEQLTRVNRLFDTGVLPRLNNPKQGRVVVTAHRIHRGDLSGHLVAQGGWEQLSLPFRALEAAEYTYRGGVWTRRPGELLRGEAFGDAEVQRLSNLVGPPDFATLFQQCEAGSESRLERHLFKLYTALPFMNSGHVLSIDTAYGMRRNSSYSVIQEWQRDSTGNHYLLDKWSDRVTYPDLRRKTLSFVKRRRVSVILVEDTAGGNALVSDLRQRLPQEIGVHGMVPLASKRERLRAVMDLVRGGLVFLPKSADWLEDFLQQLDEFPEGAFDDQVDAMVQYLGWTKENSAPGSRPQRTMGVLVKGHGATTYPPAYVPFHRVAGATNVWSPRRKG